MSDIIITPEEQKVIELDTLDQYHRLRTDLLIGRVKPTDHTHTVCSILESQLDFINLVYSTNTKADQLYQLLFSLRKDLLITKATFLMVKENYHYVYLKTKDEIAYTNLISEGYTNIELYLFDCSNRLWGAIKILPNGFCFSVRKDKEDKAEKMMNSLLNMNAWVVKKYTS